MPFKRRRTFRSFRRRRKFFRRRRFGGKNRATRRVALKALRGVRRINRGIETKTHETFNGGWPTPVAYTIVPTTYMLSGLVQGVGNNQRVGLKVKWSSISLWFYFSIGDLYNTFWVVLWRDRQQQLGVSSAPGQCYIDQGGGNLGIPPIRQWGARKRFQIYWAKKIRVGDVANASGPWPPEARFFKKIKLRGLSTQYVGTTGGVGDIQKGILYMSIWSDSSIAPNPVGSWYARITYKDA